MDGLEGKLESFQDKIGPPSTALGEFESPNSPQDGHNSDLSYGAQRCLPYSQEIVTEQQPSSQVQSILFAKLPVEIRVLIWRHLVTGVNLYLVLDREKLRLWCCKEYFGAILLTCRKSYLESVNIIYSSNTLRLLCPKSLLHLHDTLSQQRLNCIRDLCFVWPLHGPATFIQQIARTSPYEQNLGILWKATWQALVSMEGLQKLRVYLRISVRWRSIWRKYEANVFESIPNINVSEFTLCVPWNVGPTDRELESSQLESLPFQIIRDESMSANWDS